MKFSVISFLAGLLLVFGTLNMPAVLKSYYIIFCVGVGVTASLLSMKDSKSKKDKWMSVLLSIVYLVSGAFIYTAL